MGYQTKPLEMKSVDGLDSNSICVDYYPKEGGRSNRTTGSVIQETVEDLLSRANQTTSVHAKMVPRVNIK